MCLFVSVLAWFLRVVFTSRRSIVIENLALKQQLATCGLSKKWTRLEPLSMEQNVC